MKNHSGVLRLTVFSIFALLAIAGIIFALRRSLDAPSPEQAVKDTWSNLTSIGEYQFSTTVTQTTYLAPSVHNVGHTSQQDIYHISGNTNLNAKTMQVSLWQNEGSALNAKDGVEIKVDQDQAQGRTMGGQWQPIDKNVLATFAPGNDSLSFLVAARNVTDVGSEQLALNDANGQSTSLTVTHYQFDIDSNRFALFMRDQLTQELQRSGKLPLGMQLDISEEYRQMVANGSLWVSSADYPLRLRMDMHMPVGANGQRVEAVVQTDFVQPSAKQLLAAQAPARRLVGWLGFTGSGQDLNAGLVEASVILALAAFALLGTLVVNRRVAYPVTASLVIVTMLVSPVWYGAKTNAFSQSVQQQRAEQKSAEQAKADADAQARELVTSSWDPHQLSPSAPSAPLVGMTSNQPAADPYASLAGLSASLRSDEAAVGDSSDTDQDGLTDDYEKTFPNTVLDPTKADTDGDGLTDGQEVKLALSPGQVDTDHDQIADNVEVAPFEYADQKWYTNPNDNDTDKDGIADGVECPQRVINAANPAQGVCRDTDDDGIPDVFDTDDDNDGVPTYVDESPYAVNHTAYNQDKPFNLTISNLAPDKPVFITYQLRPTNPQHLTYTMNVLDWPSGDTDGQIQRISDSTFADAGNMSAQELANDSRAANGDMRLTPMVEIRFDPAGGLPLPLTDTFQFAVSDPAYSATFALTGKVAAGQSQTTVRIENGPAGKYPIYLGQGSCDDSSHVTKLGNLGVSDQQDVSIPLSHFADARYSFFIHDQQDKATIACITVPATAHGTLADQVVDSSRLTAYGAFARNDTDGTVLIYSPLSLVYDYEGSVPVAFSMKVPYVNRAGAFDTSTQSLRVVWAVNMLTDVCKPISADYDESKKGTWCDGDEPERWIKDVPRLIQTYPDAFTVTGLSVSEEDGVKMLAISENPATDPDPSYDDQLWGLAQGLQSSFLVGRTNLAGDKRDLDLTEIENRFGAGSKIPSGDARQWGLPKDAFTLHSYQYTDSDGFIDFSANQVGSLLDQSFKPADGHAYPAAVTLLFAREQNQRTLTLDDNAACGTGTCSLDFGGQPVTTDAVLNWAPYRHTQDGWETIPSGEYLDLFEARLRALSDFTPADDSDDARTEIDGQVYMARFFYESMLNGMAQLVAVNGVPAVNLPAVLDDQQIYNNFYQMNANAQVITKVVKTLTESFVIGVMANPSLRAALLNGTKTESTGAFFRAIGKGLAQKVSNFMKLFKSTFAKAIAGTVGVIAVVAITAAMVLYLMDSQSTAGRIGGRILFGSIGLLTAGLAINSLVEAAGWVRTGKQVSEASSKAALVGMVIGIIITWGVFIAQWVISKTPIFSLAFDSMLADAIAATCTIVLLAALACTGVGAIVVAVIALIDGLIAVVCAAAGYNEKSEDSWQRQYLCIGISGWITKLFKWTIYSSTYMVDYDNEKRLSFVSLDQQLKDEAAGMTEGNAMAVTIGVKNTIELSDIPRDWKAAAYFWQYSDSTAKSSAFDYSITKKDDNLHSGLDRGDTKGWTSSGDDTWSKTFEAKTDGYSIALPPAGINRDPSAVLNEGSAIPVQECWAVPVMWVLVPVCYIRTERNSIHVPIDSSLTVDVLPATLDQFYALTPAGKGYTLDWGRDAGLTFGTLKDADGDGLLSKAYPDGNDPDDSKYDTDGDGLSDSYEIANGLNPQNFDTDDDGLTDAQELAYNTDPLRKDTDGDGLPDKEEIQGWLYTYGFAADGTPRETMVYPDPNNPDADQDGLTDLMEKIYGFNPNNPDAANVLDYTLTTQELDSPLVLLGFDEAGGATAYTDSSNFGYGAVCNGSNCPVSGFSGRVGNAIHMVASDPLTLPTSARTLSLVGGRPFTLSAWVEPEGNRNGVILAKWSAAAGELVFSLTDGYPSLLGGSGSLTSTCAVPAGEWSHVAVSYDGSTATFYVNGSSSGCGGGAWGTPALASGAIPAPITIGGAVEAVPGFQGHLDEVGLFNRSLSAVEIHDRLMPANYNFNDAYVRPGEEVTYQSQVSNLLQSRFAYGTVNTTADPQDVIVDAANVLTPDTFVLYPDNPVVTGVNTATQAKTFQIDPAVKQSGDLTITQTVEASVVDRRTESNMAELWLKFDETSGATQFEDSSGNMPLRTVTCASNCPASGATGILNQAVSYTAASAPLALPVLSRMNLIDHGYTVSLWVNPQGSSTVGAILTLLDTANHRIGLALSRVSNSAYQPVLTLNGSQVPLTATGSARQVQAGTWANLVVQYTSATGELKLYLNGTVIGTKSAAGAISAAAGEALSLGGASASADFAIDDLRIFSRPLGDLDINRLAERPVLVLSMDDGSFQDSSVYHQSVSAPKQAPVTSANAVRGPTSLNPRSGSQSGFIQVQGNGMLNFSDGAFTISTWVYPTPNGSQTWQGIWGRRDNIEYDGNAVDVNAYPTLERKGTQLRFMFGSGSTYETLSPVDALTENQWNQVVVTFQPGDSGKYEMKLYVNAVVKATQLFDHAPSAISANNGFFVGQSSSATQLNINTVHMDNEHDAGTHAEVSVRKSVNGGGYSEIYYKGSVADGDVLGVNKKLYFSHNENVTVDVYEDDGDGEYFSDDDDYCGGVTRHWYDDRDLSQQSTTLHDGFDGSLDYQYLRAALPFSGLIDEMQVYRYPLDSEQVYDLYSSVMLTANLPLDDRPATTSFENSAQVGASYSGVCTLGQCPTAGATGLISQATRFDGQDDHITIPVQTTSDYMLSFWLNTTCPDCGLYQLTSSGSTLNQVFLRSANLCVDTGATETCTRGGRIADGQWHHVAYSNNGADAILYLDGATVNKLPVYTPMPAAPSGSSVLGYAPGAAHPYYNGQLDDVRIYHVSQGQGYVDRLLQRAPLFLAHLDESDPSTGLQDATLEDWSLGCDEASQACPQGGLEGRLQSAVELDGINDALQLDQHVLSATAREFTVGLWVMPTSLLNHNQTLWSLTNPQNSGLKYAISIAANSMQLCVQSASSSNCTASSAVELIQNVWNYVTLTVTRADPQANSSAETYSLYINGYLDSTGSGADDANATNGLGKFSLGNAAQCADANGCPFRGRLDEAVVYTYPLNEIDIRDSFYYQMASVEETSSIKLTIDADAPAVDLVSYDADFPYLNSADRMLQVNASDPTSGVARVEMQVSHGGEQTFQSAPVCAESGSNSAFCPTFIPDGEDGKFLLTFRAVDRVGASTSTTPVPLYVDDSAPRIVTDQLDGQLMAAELHPSLENTWFVHLSGSVADVILGDGSAGSGIDPDSLLVTLNSQTGEVVGAGSQKPALTASGNKYLWSLDYLIPEMEPTGELTLRVEAADKVGNHALKEIHIFLDASSSRSSLNPGGLPQLSAEAINVQSADQSKIYTGGTLTGTASDVPPDTGPYMSAEGEQAASAVQQVQIAFTPSLNVSYLFNQPYPDDVLAWLPLDNADVPVGADGKPDPSATTRYFVDISPYQLEGSCDGSACPQAGILGHVVGSMYFDGQNRAINLGQMVNLTNRSFTLSSWIDLAETGRNNPVLWQGPASIPQQRILYGFNAGNHFVCGFGGTDLVTPQTYPDGGWHAWACTYDLATHTRAIYRDGQRVAADSAAPVPEMSENLYVGSAPSGSLKGYLDELLVLGQGLDAPGVRSLYTGYQTVFQLGIHDKFLSSGNQITEDSGFYATTLLTTGSGDANNKVSAGQVGDYSLRMDGNDLLKVDPSFNLALDRGAFSLAAWVNPGHAQDERDVISQRDENPEQRYPSLTLAPDGKVRVGFGDGYAWDGVESDASLAPDGTWTHLLATFDGTTLNLYVNGILAQTWDSLAGKKPYPTWQFNIGDGFTGMLDDVRVYPRGLDALEAKALSETGWITANLQGSGNQVNWSVETPSGLEGSYQIDTRAWDSQGHYDTGAAVQNQWGGVIDTLAPRVSLTRVVDPDDETRATYTFDVEDTMLDETSIRMNFCDQVDVEREYYNSPWHLTNGIAVNSALNRIHGTCVGAALTSAETGLWACDTAGNCTAQTFPVDLPVHIYLPLVASSGSAPNQGAPANKVSDQMRTLAESWPPMSVASSGDPHGPGPLIELNGDRVDLSHQRNPLMLNLQGWVIDADGVAKVEVAIYQGDRQVYTTPAALTGEIWNAMWFHPAGSPPEDGEYRLVVTATDRAGVQSTLTRNITVALRP